VVRRHVTGNRPTDAGHCRNGAANRRRSRRRGRGSTGYARPRRTRCPGVNENFRTIADDSYAAAHESAGFQVQLVAERAQFFHLHDGYFGVNGDDKMFIRTQNGVRLGLAAGFVTTIEEDLDYDRRPSPGRRQTDRTFSLTLGYRF
jgi:hypothetical protein